MITTQKIYENISDISLKIYKIAILIGIQYPNKKLFN